MSLFDALSSVDPSNNRSSTGSAFVLYMSVRWIHLGNVKQSLLLYSCNKIIIKVILFCMLQSSSARVKYISSDD